MSLGVKTAQAAQKESLLQRPFPQRAEAVVALPKGGEVRATAKIVDTDKFSKLASKITVSTDKKTGVSVEDKAAKFAAKTTYLTEKLEFVEKDIGGTAIVRSSPATMAGRGAPYYEAKVGLSEITLERYQSKKDGCREKVPFCLTDDILVRLVDDSADVLVNKKE
jgi:hypothetical protein